MQYIIKFYFFIPADFYMQRNLQSNIFIPINSAVDRAVVQDMTPHQKRT